MFSKTVEYALRAVVHLASKAPAAQTTDQIAAATKVEHKAYLSKVLQGLCRKGVVHSQRGIGGGMTLVKRPEELTILEVVNAVEPIGRIRTCPLGLAAHGVNLCPLHKRVDDALAMVENAFRNSTLAEVLAEPTSSVPLCDFPGLPMVKDCPS
jgi:Rrf2 family transcriptional regulator, nitric oxide-sensitive transcriptional repressor